MHISFYVIKKIAYRYHTNSVLILACIILLIIESNISISGQEKTSTGVHASVSGTLNCINTFVNLIGSSENENTVYRWNGPNGYVATAKESLTTIPGNYTLVATDPSTGISSASSVIVRLDTITPIGVVAEVSGDITCRDTLVTLMGKSFTKGVTYFWEGPQGFSSKEKEIGTTVSGYYRLIVTNPSNGCTSTANVYVRKDIEKPEDLNASASGILTCKITSVSLKAFSSTKNVIYRWSGPDFKADSAHVNVVVPGEYQLTVTNPLNSCSSETRIMVKQDITPPKEVIATVSDTLDCTSNTVTVAVSPDNGTMIYAWEGPGNFTSGERSFKTYYPGSYTVTITDPGNGCSTKRRVQVVQDTIHPNDVTLISSGILTCKTKKVTLSGNSQLSGLTFEWTGPDNFISKSPAPEVKVPGKYRATITNPQNGCSSIKSLTVSQDTLAPSGVSVLTSDTLDCLVKTINLTGFSDTRDVVFKWTGPQNFTATGQIVTTSYPGKYFLTVTNPLNGCISEASIKIIEKECAD